MSSTSLELEERMVDWMGREGSRLARLAPGNEDGRASAAFWIVEED
jgi:hypothetical protein